LWQVTQYCCINGRAVCVGAAAGACPVARKAREPGLSASTVVTTANTIRDLVMCLDL
jgi:hypothetical protein